MTILYRTPEIQIGKHRWRCRVEMNTSYGACTNYQWFDPGMGIWRDSDRWPRYNSNDTYNGCPRTLEKLYHAHEREIYEALIRGKEQWLLEHAADTDEWAVNFVRKRIEEDKERLEKLKGEIP